MDRRAFLAGTAGLVLAPDALARRLGGTPTALVTADLESHVAAVELSTGRVVRRIRTMAGPRSIESVRQTLAVVAHTERGALTIIDGRSLDKRAEVDGFGEPRYTVAGRDGRYVHVTDSKRGEVVTVDVERARIVYRTAVEGPARHLAIHPSGRLLWVSLGNAAERIAVLDLTDPRRPHPVIGGIVPPFPVHDVGFAPGGNRAWVTSGDRGSILIYDVRTRKVRSLLAADSAPQHVTFTPTSAFVASGDDGLLRIHSLDGRLVATNSIPAGSYNVQRDWNVVLTPSLSQGTLCVVGRDGRIRKRVRVARSSHDACFVVSS